MKAKNNKEMKWHAKKRNKLQKSLKKRSTFGREFRKRFVPIFLSLALLLTSFLYVMYKQVVSDAEKAFENSQENMQRDFDDCYMYMTTERGVIWDDQTIQDFERYLTVAMNCHGTTGNYLGLDQGLMFKDKFTDFTSNLYVQKLDEHGSHYELVKGTCDYVYLLEKRGKSLLYDRPTNIYRIYSCPVEDIREAYDFQLEHRQKDPKNPIKALSGFPHMDSFYANYETGTFKPEHISLYELHYVKEHQFGGGYAEYSEEKLVKEISYNQTDVENYTYINYMDDDFIENYTAKNIHFYGPYYAGSKEGGPADTILQNELNHIKESYYDGFDSMGQFIKIDTSHHGMVLEYVCFSPQTFSPITNGLWDEYPEYSSDTGVNATDGDEITYYYYKEENTNTDAEIANSAAAPDDLGQQQSTLQLVKETSTTDTNNSFHAPSDYNHTYVACFAATMDLRELYGTKVIIYYLSMLTISLLAAFLFARRSYSKLSLQYQMMDYRKALTDSMAHDLKSPLMAISGYAENLKENIYTDQKDVYADKILDNIEYMNQIVSDVLELSKAESETLDASLKITDIKVLFENIFEKYTNSMNEKDISYELQGELKLKADSRMMDRVIDNLICNAVTHGLNSCTIKVNLEKNGFTIKNSFDEETIDIDFLKTKNKKATIEKYSKQKNTFDILLNPFVKGNKNRTNHQGSGLGLAIVKELLETQGYKLAITVEDGEFLVKVK